jgi:hypothetical protein
MSRNNDAENLLELTKASGLPAFDIYREFFTGELYVVVPPEKPHSDADAWCGSYRKDSTRNPIPYPKKLYDYAYHKDPNTIFGETKEEDQ